MILAVPSISRTTKESLKTAVAMVVTYTIALSAGWDKSMWAGLAVALVSQQTLGLSLNKAALRMLGTLAAIVVALTLIALFPQQRWLFMGCLSLWVGACAYFLLGSSRPYFWQVSGFVSVIICVGAATASEGAFEVAMLRAQQTGLGVLVYSLVAMLVWPCSSRDQLFEACQALHASHLLTIRKITELSSKTVTSEELARRVSEMVQAQSRLEMLLDAAIADSQEIWEARRQWRVYLSKSAAVTTSMQQLCHSQPLDCGSPLSDLLPNLAEFSAGLEQSFVQLQALIGGEIGRAQPSDDTLQVDARKLRQLSLFDAGVVAQLRHQLEKLSSQTSELLLAATAARYGVATGPVASDSTTPSTRLMPDTDRLWAVLRVMGALWSAYLAYLFVDGLPGGATFVTLTGSLALGLARYPQIAPARLITPVALCILLSGIIYLFVMPRLEGVRELGLLLFVVTFGICQLFADPKRQAGRVIGLAIFVTVCSVNNQQTYSFIAVANMALLFPLVLLLLSAFRYFPSSPRPERVFQRLLARFFRSSAFLLACASASQRSQILDWRMRYHRFAVSTIPARLATWSELIDKRYLPGESRCHLQELVLRCNALSFQSGELVSALSGERSALPPFQTWRDKARTVLRRLADYWSTGVTPTSPAEVAPEGLIRMEQAIREAAGSRGKLSAADIERQLRLLGLSRGVADSLKSLTELSEQIELEDWREERFF